VRTEAFGGCRRGGVDGVLGSRAVGGSSLNELIRFRISRADGRRVANQIVSDHLRLAGARQHNARRHRLVARWVGSVTGSREDDSCGRECHGRQTRGSHQRNALVAAGPGRRCRRSAIQVGAGHAVVNRLAGQRTKAADDVVVLHNQLHRHT